MFSINLIKLNHDVEAIETKQLNWGGNELAWFYIWEALVLHYL